MAVRFLSKTRSSHRFVIVVTEPKAKWLLFRLYHNLPVAYSYMSGLSDKLDLRKSNVAYALV